MTDFLPIQTIGPADGAPVVLLHGFLADSRQWHALVAAVTPQVARPIRWLLPDLPGHGQAAARFPAASGWPALTAMLSRSLQPHLRQPPLLGGYSMGGRIAAALAASRQLPFAGLWLESAHPPLAEAAAQARRIEDEQRAQALEQQGIAAFVAAWEALPLFASQLTLPTATRDAQRQLRLGQDPRGLAQNLRWYGTGTMPDDLRLPGPTHLLVGAIDTKLRDRLPTWHAIAPQLSCAIVAGAGHAVHLERLDATAAHLASAIAATDFEA